MQKVLLAIIAGASLCALSACSNTGYTKVTDPDGSTVVHGHVDKGTTVTSDGNGSFTIDANKGPEQQYQVPTVPGAA
jgi:hypothetical protein